MNATLQKHHPKSGTGQSAPRVLIIVSLFVLLFATEWLITSRNFFAPSAPEPADRYIGLVQLAPDQQGRCEQLELDNKAGLLRTKGFARCDDIVSSVEPSNGGPLGRLNGIVEHFKSR